MPPPPYIESGEFWHSSPPKRVTIIIYVGPRANVAAEVVPRVRVKAHDDGGDGEDRYLDDLRPVNARVLNHAVNQTRV